jgi:hypothetical protein
MLSRIKTLVIVIVSGTASVATDPEDPGASPGATRFSEQ